MDEPTTFSGRLAALIEESGATHKLIARWMGVSRVAVTLWTQGGTEPNGRAKNELGAPVERERSEAIERLARFFGCSPEWLYFGRGKRPAKAVVVSAVHEAIGAMALWPSSSVDETADAAEVA
jgi:transposase-like protein